MPSTSTVNARDRIGAGPWYNRAGELIASSVASLHQCDPTGDPNGGPLCAPFAYQRALSETGVIVPPNEHDILTGSDADGVAVADTCQNWTSGLEADTGEVGHSDAADTGNVTHNVVVYVWGGAHVTIGCSPGTPGPNGTGLKGTGGSGRIYCFAY